MSATVSETVAKPPDLTYAPDYEKYQARTKRRLETENLDLKSLPAGFPRELKSDLVWEGEGLAEKYDWTFELTPSHIAELEEALKHFKALDQPIGHVSQATFPLPTLHAPLRALSRELHHGHGFTVVRGLPVDAHTRADNLILYAGLASHIAPQRGRQDHQYGGAPADVVLTHIKDLSKAGAATAAARIGAPAYTTDKQVFHTDAGDIVSLLALGTAAEGGTSRLASTWRVYNQLAAERPDLVATLAADWIAEDFTRGDRRGVTKPLLFHQPPTGAGAGGNVGAEREDKGTPERVQLQYARRYFTGFGALPRSATLPPISEAQAEALDALHFLGERFSVGLDFRKGDAQFINNLAVFHARDAFTDSESQQRHLVRLWLRDPEYAWETPEPLRARWAQMYDDVKPENQVFPLEPYVRSASNGAAKT